MSNDFKLTLAAIFFVVFASVFAFFLMLIHKDYTELTKSQATLSTSIDNQVDTFKNFVATQSAVKTATKSAK